MINRRCGVALGAILISVQASASPPDVDRLREALIKDDLITFSRVLEVGTVDPDVFATDERAYEVFCYSTHPSRAAFFDRLLEFGVDPSVKDPTGSRYTFSPLVCASREDNAIAFERLLDAGARSDLSVCPTCANPGHTLIAHIWRQPEIFDLIVERRELTPLELDSLARNVESLYIHKTWNNRPVNEYYADYLRARGYEVEPQGPYGQDRDEDRQAPATTRDDR